MFDWFTAHPEFWPIAAVNFILLGGAFLAGKYTERKAWLKRDVPQLPEIDLRDLKDAFKEFRKLVDEAPDVPAPKSARNEKRVEQGKIIKISLRDPAVVATPSGNYDVPRDVKGMSFENIRLGQLVEVHTVNQEVKYIFPIK